MKRLSPLILAATALVGCNLLPVAPPGAESVDRASIPGAPGKYSFPVSQFVFVSDIVSHPNWANFRGVVLQSGLRAAWSTHRPSRCA